MDAEHEQDKRVAADADAKDILQQQAAIQRQAVGSGGVGVVAAALEAGEKSNQMEQQTCMELLAREKHQNAESMKRVTTTLQDRMKQVDSEAKKLALVRAELAKLEGNFNKSVDILRGEIETVGLLESQAQKDYAVKEAAYLTARHLLSEKKQRKALLTGHLHEIILSNEKQKAEKLRDMEQQLSQLQVASGSTRTPPQQAFRGFS
jgi:hypothetical protein